MKAAIYRGIEDIAVQDAERIAPAPGYILIDTRATGVCGSDLHAYFGRWPPSREVAQGHETCGLIAEVGEGVEGLAIGDRVAVEVCSYCANCVFCRKGLYNHCVERGISWEGGHGGFAEYTTAHASSVFRLPDDMSFEDGALVEPLAVGVRAVAQSGASHADRVGVIGGGTIGLMCLAAAKAVGVRETLITVKYPQQAAAARDFGADHVVNVAERDVKEQVAEITDGFGLDAVVETIGSASAFDEALAIVRPRGAVVLVGGYHQPLEVNLAPIMGKEPMVTGSNCYAYSDMVTDFDAAIDLIASGRVDARRIVTHRYPLSEIAEAFRISADKESGVVKAHVVQ